MSQDDWPPAFIAGLLRLAVVLGDAEAARLLQPYRHRGMTASEYAALTPAEQATIDALCVVLLRLIHREEWWR